jgi:hypothetical protein
MEFLTLHGVCKNFNAEVAEEYAKFAKMNFETLCFNVHAEFNDTFFTSLLLSFKIQY